MKLLRIYLLLGLLLGHWAAAWAAPIVLDAHPRGLLLCETGQLQWLADAGGTLTLDDVRAPA
ncbi:MAG: GGDEF domain-containing protein, partial [Comamonadaceae bacterium]|nr:GGDEF domain-containing protein [Comamonadaceae bacterium]